MKSKRMKLSVLMRAITIFALVVSIFSSFSVGTVFAEAGYALEFDGVSDYVKLGDTGNLMGGDIWASSKTVSLWVRPDAPTSPATRPEGGVFLVGNDRPRFFGITRATWEGADRIWVWNYDSNGTDMIGIDFVPGEWLQIALVHSGGVLSAYKNGVLVGSVASGTTVIPNGTGDGYLYIGGSDNSRTVKFAGQIDEVRMWNVGLDGATVLNWAYTEVTEAHPNWVNLMAYYQMSDGAGLTLTDNSAYSNTGSLLGGMADANWVISGAFGGG